MKNSKLSHTDEKGNARMVDVGHKPEQIRIARATGFISLQKHTIDQIIDNSNKKGAVLSIAEIAGIQAAKKTSDLIPLCHPLQLTKVEVIASVESKGVRINSMAKCIGQTGVEMEALTAVSVGLLTIYDMCKAVDKQMEIIETRLVEKTKSNPKDDIKQ